MSDSDSILSTVFTVALVGAAAWQWIRETKAQAKAREAERQEEIERSNKEKELERLRSQAMMWSLEEAMRLLDFTNPPPSILRRVATLGKQLDLTPHEQAGAFIWARALLTDHGITNGQIAAIERWTEMGWIDDGRMQKLIDKLVNTDADMTQ